MRGFQFLLLSCLSVSVASAEVPVHLEGQLGGASQAIAVSETGAIAYLGVGPRVVMLDISAPGNLRETAQSEVLPEVVEDIVIRDGHAYVADGSAGLYVMDVSDANAPRIVGRWSGPSGVSVARGLSVRLSGDYAYLADGSAGLQIIDISNPAKPAGVSVVTEVTPQTVAVSDGYAYVDSPSEGVTVIDVSDPRRPRMVAQSKGLPNPMAIEVVDGFIYIAGGLPDKPGLFVIDASDPENPACVGRCEIANAGALALAGKLAYVSNGWGGLDIIRITYPALPSRIGGYETTGHAEAVAVSAGRAYIAEGYGGLEVVDVSSPATPVGLASYATTSIHDVAVSDRYAYVVSAYTGMQIVDVCDPVAPSYVSWLDLDYADCVALGKTHVYVGDGWDLKVIDVSDPLEPVVIASCEVGYDIRDVVAVDRYAYLAAGQSLAVVDVADPCSPVPVGWCSTPGYAHGVCIASGYAYVTGTEGLDIIDISNPVAPFKVGRYNEGDWPSHAALSGTCAFLASGNSGLRVIDVSDPFLPGYVSGVDTYLARDIVIRDPYAFLLDFRDGLQIFDISHPGLLGAAGECDVAGYPHTLAISGDYAYVASASGGLVVLKIDWPRN